MKMLSLEKAVLFSIFLFCSLHTTAQPYSRKLNGGNDFDYGHSIAQTKDGGICIAGATSSFGSGNDDVYIIKLDSLFNQLWAKTYDWGLKEFGLSITATADNGFAITGYTQRNAFTDSLYDMFVLKIDAGGNVLWNRSFGGSHYESGNGIIETTNGDLIIAGNTSSYGQGQNDINIIKLDAQGHLIWNRSLGTSKEDLAYSITPAVNGGFAIAGAAAGFMPFITCCDSAGNVSWSKIIAYDSAALGAFNSIAQTADNGFILTGYTNTPKAGYDILCAKVSSAGKVKWCGTMGNRGDDKGYSIIQDDKENFILTGYINFNRRGFAQNLYAVKLSPAGKPLWNKAVTEQSEASGSAVMQWKDKGYVITGAAWQTTDGALYKPDIYLAVFDTSGLICGASGTENKMHILHPFIDSLTLIQAAGGGPEDNIVTTYRGSLFRDQCPGENPPPAVTANKFSLQAPWATILSNPVSGGLLQLRFSKPFINSAQVIIMGAGGNVVLSQKLSPAQNTYSIPVAALPNGVYILNIISGHQQQTIKFIKAG